MNMTSQASVRIPGPSEDLELGPLRGRPLAFLEEMAKRYGDAFSYRVEEWPVVVVSHPDAVATVLRADVHSFTKERTPDHFMLRPLLGNGLLTSSGDEWRQQRHALAPLFRPSDVSRFDTVITEAAAALAARWSGPEQGVVDVEGPLSSLTLEILVQAVFGRALHGVGSGFGSAVTDINSFIGRFRGSEVAHDPQAARSHKRYIDGANLVRGITNVLIDSFGHTNSASSAVFIARMRSLVESKQGLHDQVLTLLMAGHETTAKTLLWSLHLLAEHPDQQAAVAAEAAAVGGGRALTSADLPALSTSAAVVREAMRLYPPVWLISRRARVDSRLAGYAVPAGTLVCLSPWLVHRDARWWPEPKKFRPERFGPGSARPGPFTYFPFGGGERVCVGQHLALLEATLILSTVLAQCVVEPASEALPEPEALVTLRPRAGMPLRLRPRAGTGAGRTGTAA